MSGKARGPEGPPIRAAALTLALALATPAALSGAGEAEDPDTDAPAATAAVRDETGAASATTVKAAFLIKFLGYVDFPAGPLDPGAPYVVGVVGADDIAAELARLTAGRVINRHAVVVRKLDGAGGAGGVHLLFIGAADSASEAALADAAQQAGVLTVTESATGIEAGGVINFILVDERVRFEVSLAAADKGKLKLSSRLLSVAHTVHKGGG